MTTLQFPKQQARLIASRTERLLFLCAYEPSIASALSENVARLQAHSAFPITSLNLHEHHIFQKESRRLLLNLSSFVGIIIHSSIGSHVSSVQRYLKHFAGVTFVLSEKDDLNKEAFDLQIATTLEKNNRVNKPLFTAKKPLKNVLLLAAHEPVKDPRLGWIVNNAPPSLNVIQLGVNIATNESILIQPGEALYQQRWPKAIDERFFIEASKTPSGLAAIYELRELERLLHLPKEALFEQYGVPFGSPRLLEFYWHIRSMLNSIKIIINQSVNLRGLNAIIATDLATLPAAVMLKGLFNIPILYDAHEYWPESDIENLEFEKEFWVTMEGRLLKHTDYRQTVSTPLADFMSRKYGLPFNAVPNCVPLNEECFARETPKDQCRFLFQGNFAVGRGVDLLIKAWPKTDAKAILLLRGPDSPHKQDLIKLAKQTGLYNSRIQFLPAVKESELVNALSDGDVGIIPYMPFLANYTHCCPNKLSQYLAAKCPILANNTVFVKEIIETSQSGLVVDFSDEEKLVACVAKFLADPAARLAMGEKGNHFFKTQFHWEKVSAAFYQAIDELTKNKDAHSLEVFLSQPTPMYNEMNTKGHFSPLKWVVRFLQSHTSGHTIALLKKYMPMPLKRRLRLYWE